MSVQSTISSIQYVGNASSSTAYPIPFYFILATDIVVLLTNAAGVVTTLNSGTDYTVTGAGVSSGGSLTTTVAYDATNTLTIARSVPITQITSYQVADKFPAASQEKALDRLTMICQQLSRAIGKCVRGGDASADLTPFPSTPSVGSYVLQVVSGVLTWALPATVSMTDGSVTPSKMSTGGPSWTTGGVLTAAGFVGNLTGNVTGNASSASTLTGSLTGTALTQTITNALIFG